MIIKSVRVQRFRGILDETFQFGKMSAIVGANGCGKSTIFRALELFYDPSQNPTLGVEDFFGTDCENPIEITVTFTNLSEGAKTRFRAFVEQEELSVTRVVEFDGQKANSRFHGSHMQNPDFRAVRAQSGSQAKINTYRHLVAENPEYSGLPSVRSAQDVQKAMEDWEKEHPDRLQRMTDDGQFFGLHNVNRGYLGDFTQFLLIPAVQDATESALDGRNSPVNRLVNFAVRNTLSTLSDFQSLRESAEENYSSILAEYATPKLGDLRMQLSDTLRTFVPNSHVDLDWISEGGIDIRMPHVQVALQEHGFEGPVGNMGHGLQRAFMISLLQHLAYSPADEEPQSNQEVVQSVPSLVLAIEEPELFQHPNRQRHFARVLRDLSHGSIQGVSDETQILYSTHSPLFVGIDRIPEIILLRKKHSDGDTPGFTTARQVTGDDIASELWRTVDPQGRRTEFTWESLRPRMSAIMNPFVNEAFFADLVVLVEGEEDRAAVLAAAYLTGYDFEATGISVVPCGGKNNLDRPLMTFRAFGLPVFVVWDVDGDADAYHNQVLRRSLGIGAQLDPWPGTHTGANWSCFEPNVTELIRSELGRLYRDHMDEVQQEFGFGTDENAQKRTMVMYELFRRCAESGVICNSLDRTARAIAAYSLNQGIELVSADRHLTVPMTPA